MELLMGPTRETAYIGPDSFLTDCPSDRYKTGHFARLPHILGFTHDELLLLSGSIENNLIYFVFG